MWKIKNKFNNIDGMLLATFLTNLFYSSTYPYIHKELMMVISDKMVAINQIINCLSIVIFSSLWNKLSTKLFKFYPVYCILETMLGVCTTILAITTDNLIIYYILDTFVFCIVTRNIICGGIKLRALRYTTEDKREQFDNNNNSMSAISTIIGSCVAMVLNLSFPIMLILATIGNAIDNIFYIVIYYKTNKLRKEN